jgi:DNA-binding IclR family transcriptional regulator
MTTRMASTVTKALSILDLFLNHEEGLSVTKIYNLSGINISTVVRLCATLENSGYLKRNSQGIYFIGHQIEKLAQIYRIQFSVEDIIRPLLTELRDKTGESASFNIIDGNERLCLFRADSKKNIRHVLEEGTKLPLEKGIVGPLLLAFSGKKGDAYDELRSQGYLDGKGRASFTSSVAVPVFTGDGSLVGALAVSGLSARFGEKKRALALNLLLEYSKKLTQCLPVQDIRR